MITWNRTKIFFCYYLPLLLYASLIIYLSNRPDYPIKTPDIKNLDKSYHFIEYSIFAYLQYRAFLIDNRKKFFSVFIFVLAFTCGFAITDEIHQFFIPGREMSVFDMMADISGAIATSFAYLIIYRSRKFIG